MLKSCIGSCGRIVWCLAQVLAMGVGDKRRAIHDYVARSVVLRQVTEG